MRGKVPEGCFLFEFVFLFDFLNLLILLLRLLNCYVDCVAQMLDFRSHLLLALDLLLFLNYWQISAKTRRHYRDDRELLGLAYRVEKVRTLL